MLPISNRDAAGLSMLLLLVLVPPPTGAQTTKNGILTKRVRSFRMSYTRISDPLKELALSYRVPIGLEIAEDTAGPKQGVKVEVETGTVRDVLDAIIKGDPRYEWKQTDGVINVLPKEDRSQILETLVSEIALDDTNRQDCILAIIELPALRDAIEKAGSKLRDFLSVPAEPYYSLPRFSLKLHNVTFRQALNQIMQPSHSSFWFFSRSGGFLSIGFR